MSAAAEARAGEHEGAPLRMKDLCAQNGLSRQAIHFYIHEGLVPEGKKTGRNMAWYGPEHVERLLLVRRLQEERFLPLKAIRALVGGDAGELATAQRGLLLEVRSRLPQPLTEAPVAFEDLASSPRVTGSRSRTPTGSSSYGLLAVREHEGRREVSSASEWLLNLWGQFRAIGFTAELGFGPDDLLIYDEAIGALFQRARRGCWPIASAGQPADRLATMVAQALPLIHAILIHLHSAAVRGFFASLDAARPLGAPAATTDISEAP